MIGEGADVEIDGIVSIDVGPDGGIAMHSRERLEKTHRLGDVDELE